MPSNEREHTPLPPDNAVNLRSEEGFTLIELLIAVAIMTVVTSAVGLTFITGLTLTDQTNQRLQLSNDAEFASAHLVSDLQSMSGNFSTTSRSCGEDLETETLVFSLDRYLQETSTTQYTTTATVSYVLEEVADQQKKLVRKYCNPPPPLGSPSDTLIASYVGDDAPTVTCEPDCSGSPNIVTVRITDCARNPLDACDPNQPNFTYELKGSGRKRS